MKPICETCARWRRCNTMDRKRGDPCIQFKHEADPARQAIKPHKKEQEQTTHEEK